MRHDSFIHGRYSGADNAARATDGPRSFSICLHDVSGSGKTIVSSPVADKSDLRNCVAIAKDSVHWLEIICNFGNFRRLQVVRSLRLPSQSGSCLVAKIVRLRTNADTPLRTISFAGRVRPFGMEGRRRRSDS